MKIVIDVEDPKRWNEKAFGYCIQSMLFSMFGVDSTFNVVEDISEERLQELATTAATNYGYQVAGGSVDRPMLSEAHREGIKVGVRLKESML